MNRLKEIEKRMKDIGVEIEQEGVDLDALDKEIEDLKEERQLILDNAEKRQKMLDRVANLTDVTVLGVHQEERKIDDDKLGADSREYRSAFLKKLTGSPLTELEERAYTHTTQNTGAVVPVGLQNEIFSNMEESHPILKDVRVLRTGTALDVTKHVSIDEGDAKIVGEAVANDDEENSFVRVSLSGKSFSKHVEISYALGKMAIPAFEQYLVSEISSRIGSAMADDVIAQIRSDVNDDNVFDTDGNLQVKDILKGLGALKGAKGQVYVYANNSTLYNSVAGMEDSEGRLSFIPDIANDISARLLGRGVKEEDALDDGEILIIDPKQFIYNVISDVNIRRGEDIKRHVDIISGIAIAEGVLTNDKGASIVNVTP